MLKTLLIVYLGINILTWILIIPWLIIYLKDKYYNQEEKIETKTATTNIKSDNADNNHYSEYISGKDFIDIFFPTVESCTYVKPLEKFYYHGQYLTKDEVIKKAYEILRRKINY